MVLMYTHFSGLPRIKAPAFLSVCQLAGREKEAPPSPGGLGRDWGFLVWFGMEDGQNRFRSTSRSADSYSAKTASAVSGLG